MKKMTLLVSSLLSLATPACFAFNLVHDEASLVEAVQKANRSTKSNRIIFEKNADIELTSPIIYTGNKALTIIGNGATIDGSKAGSFEQDADLTAVTDDGTLLFNTSGDIRISNLTVHDSATRGIVVNVPADANGSDIKVMLNKVTITDSALYGLHIDDNQDEFDDGTAGSDIGVNLIMISSSFTGNGTGAIDFDGVRVDERQKGSITAYIINTEINGNGGDGIELDEAGTGNVTANVWGSEINNNGFYNVEDLDDGFDIDEADSGNINFNIISTEVIDNLDEGLDLDEAGDGSVSFHMHDVFVSGNKDEGIKVDEEDKGNIRGYMNTVDVNSNGDDGIQLTELGEGKIRAYLESVLATDNSKYGIKAEQWIEEDEEVSAEKAGVIKQRNVTLSGNGKGDELKVNNITIK